MMAWAGSSRWTRFWPVWGESAPVVECSFHHVENGAFDHGAETITN